MKTQDVVISCIYANEGESIQEIMSLSIMNYFMEELEKLDSAPAHYV